MTSLQDQNGLPVIKFSLPVTECAPEGEDMQCAPQTSCITDLEVAIQNHFHINPTPPNAHLFAWKHPKSSLHPLSQNQVTLQIMAITRLCNLSNLKGHSLCIGGTLSYLLKGVPFNVAKVMAHDVVLGYHRIQTAKVDKNPCQMGQPIIS
ncbi:hypothetical protein PAXRUDRAFT_172377 [Paxillus rubicundulus Ve08.2h10]|uniref:Uncharacterized protein n=1 Tax=Paxillus rubicundulus Ve08.2h10 TaxID=930991 RepID=A0A0D0CWV5_9AGAM|nr:hypothetical protein PAXRUDRAFT_172377 [Paxillus rubicundulus Ve08.2h10]